MSEAETVDSVPWVARERSEAMVWAAGWSWAERRGQLGLVALAAPMFAHALLGGAWSGGAAIGSLVLLALAGLARPWWTCVVDDVGVGFALTNRASAPTLDDECPVDDRARIPWDEIEGLEPDPTGVIVRRASGERAHLPVPSAALREALAEDLRARAARSTAPDTPEAMLARSARVLELVERLEAAVRSRDGASMKDVLAWRDTAEGRVTVFRAPWHTGASRWTPVGFVVALVALVGGLSVGTAAWLGLLAVALVLGGRQPWTACEIRANGVRFETRASMLDQPARQGPTGRWATVVAWVDVIGVAESHQGVVIRREGGPAVRIGVPVHLRRALQAELRAHAARHRAAVVDKPEDSRAARSALGALTGRDS